MNIEQVNLGDRSYPIFIGRGSSSEPQAITDSVTGNDALILTNETVGPLYLEQIKASLPDKNIVTFTLPDGEQEKTLKNVHKVIHHMREAGLQVERYEPKPGRPSLIGRLVGTGQGPTLMLNAHYDTVGVEGMQAPFNPIIENDRLYGRGSYDMKGSLAACIEATRAIAMSEQALAGDVLVAAVADEEYASIGTADLLVRRERGELDFDAAIVTEPTSLALCVAHRGFTWLEIETQGLAAHGSRYHIGVDANIRMGRVLRELEALLSDLQARPGHPLLGPPSLHASMIEGGVGISTYSPSCKLQIERRTVPPESCLLYTSPRPRDATLSRLPSSA